MARELLIILFAGVMIGSCIAQEQINYLERLLRQERFEELRELLDSVQGHHPSVEFMRGLVQEDAQLAVSHFRQVIQHPDSPYADDAQFRIAQYYYARGDYSQAKNQYSRLAKLYPNSNLFDDSVFLYGQCLLADGEIDSARIVFESFIQKFPKSTYANQAVMDLESSFFQETDSGPAQTNGPEIYSIQVGAFSEVRNAQHFARQLRKVNLPVEIFARTREGERLYVVWVGKFKTRESAERYARRWDSKFSDGYHIVRVNHN
ncbi:tetratricopeptide repeat protein [candidate division KSB1 bacterium]|nr:tetratricopeptide repeat protein [candidate division KSB1 bacterium]